MYNTYYVYMMSSNSNNALYIGVTGDLIRRVQEHKSGTTGGFTSKYLCHKLVYFESTSSSYEAISREKQIKSWSRKRKEKLITEKNPRWVDLYESLFE